MGQLSHFEVLFPVKVYLIYGSNSNPGMLSFLHVINILFNEIFLSVNIIWKGLHKKLNIFNSNNSSSKYMVGPA